MPRSARVSTLEVRRGAPLDLSVAWRKASSPPGPAGQVLTGDHRVVGHQVERPLLRGADAEEVGAARTIRSRSGIARPRRKLGQSFLLKRYGHLV